MGQEKFSSRSGSYKEMLIPFVSGERTCLGFYRAFCSRFGIDASGADSDWGPIQAWFPEGRVRWDRVLAAIDYSDLRLVVRECPEFFATFAVSRDEIEGEDEQFEQFPDPKPATGYKLALPEQLIPPRCFRAVWTLTSPMHHGADDKYGNVSLFRRQLSNDPLTGTSSYVPFVAGGAIRGGMRDLMFGRWLQLLGIKSTELPPFRAHSILAGGAVEKGVDTAKVNNVVRSVVRRVCPPWDLFAGCLEQQIMGGRGRIGDAVLVCRENAWQTYEAVKPGIPLGDWVKSLPESCTMTEIRQGTRHKHADLNESDGIQMIFNTEVLCKGYQMVHTLHLWCIDGVSPVTASCMSDMLSEFRNWGQAAAGNSHGFGTICFDAYQPGPGTPVLPSSDLYLDFVEKNKQEAIDWCLSARTPVEEKTKKPSKSKRSTEDAAGAEQ
jgi:hypothetical protein